MPEIPTIAPVTLTVSDLNRSVSWYERLFGSRCYLTRVLAHFDGPSGSLAATLSSDFISFLARLTAVRSMSVELVWTIWPLTAAVGASLKRGNSGWKNSGLRTAASSMLVMVLGCPSVIPTTSRWSSSLRPLRTMFRPTKCGTQPVM
jgi:hypothetical protein